MILIVSENDDLITDCVIEWLYSFHLSNIVRIKEVETAIIINKLC
jgi:hypothetical protein